MRRERQRAPILLSLTINSDTPGSASHPTNFFSLLNHTTASRDIILLSLLTLFANRTNTSVLVRSSGSLIESPNRAFDFHYLFISGLLTCYDTRLSPFLKNWSHITSDKWVLTIIAQGYGIEFLELPPPCVIITPPSAALREEIKTLLQKSAITPVYPDP